MSVKESELKPDPVTIQLNDVVAWVFGAPRQFDVSLVETVDQILDTARSQKALAPRLVCLFVCWVCVSVCVCVCVPVDVGDKVFMCFFVRV